MPSLTRWIFTGGCLLSLLTGPANADGLPWKRYHGAGVSISYPSDWSVTLKGSTLEVASPDHASVALVQLYTHGAGETPEGRIKTFVAQQSTRFAQARMGAITHQPCSAGKEAMGVLSYHARGSAARAWVVALVKPNVGYVFAMGTPSAEQRPTLLKVISSFGFDVASGSQSSLADVRYQTWTDPLEQAYTTEVPVGWKVSGGMIRFSPTLTRSSMVLQSPDGQVAIFHGDANLPTFELPSPLTHQLREREGDSVSIGPGVPGILARYYPAAQFNQWYAANRLSHILQNVQLGSVQDLPDLAQRLQVMAQANDLTGGRLQCFETASQVTFTGTSQDGKPVAGILTSATRQAAPIWQAFPTVCLYPADAASTAQPACAAITERLYLGEQTNRAWLEQRYRVAIQVANAQSQQIHAMMQQQAQAFAEQSQRSFQQTQDYLAHIHARADAQAAQDDARHASVGQFNAQMDARTANTRVFQDRLLDQENVVDNEGNVTKRSSNQFHFETQNGTLIDSDVQLISTPGVNLTQLQTSP